MAVAGLRRAKKPTKIKTAESHPYEVRKRNECVSPGGEKVFPSFESARNHVRGQLMDLETMAKHLNASEMLTRLLDLRSMLDNLTDAGGLVAGVFDPHTGMSFDALIVKRG
ncbi:MAG TPA: hypothetical protein VJQ57_09440 [Acidimicrobiia bacterium]|nr:hypothetical protein [Acidimicrobiia bacterium]